MTLTFSPPVAATHGVGHREHVRRPHDQAVHAHAAAAGGNTLTSIMFLLIFRFVFGGAIQTGDVEYVDFLIPALAAVNGLFAGGAVGVAEDTESGLFDRLRSLPVPRWALLLGRSLADTALIMWGTLVTLVVGVIVGFRVSGGIAGAFGAIALCLLFAAAFSWLQMYLGLVSGSAGRAGHLVRRVPADLRVERLCARRVDARLAAAVRREPTGHGDGRIGAGARAGRRHRDVARPHHHVVRHACRALVDRHPRRLRHPVVTTLRPPLTMNVWGQTPSVAGRRRMELREQAQRGGAVGGDDEHIAASAATGSHAGRRPRHG